MCVFSEVYYGLWDDICLFIMDDCGVNYILFESYVVDGLWNCGWVVIIGDVVYFCLFMFV